MVDAAALRVELDTDPTGIGYAPFLAAGNDVALVEALNLPRVGIAIDRDIIPSYELFEAIVPTEWAAATAQEKQRVQLILSMGEVDVRGANTRSAFQAAFGVGTTTRANLITLLTRQGSRAEQLFGRAVAMQDVINARAL